MDSYDYYCYICGIGLTEDEVLYDSAGYECCEDCLLNEDENEDDSKTFDFVKNNAIIIL